MSSALQKMESWLERRWMGRFVNVLVEANWTSLHSLKDHTPSQKTEIIALFEKPGHRLKMRLLLEELKKREIDDLIMEVTTRQGEPSISVPPQPVLQDDSSSTDTSSSDSDSDQGPGAEALPIAPLPPSAVLPAAPSPPGADLPPAPAAPAAPAAAAAGEGDAGEAAEDEPASRGEKKVTITLPPAPAPPQGGKGPPPPVPPVPADAPPPVSTSSLPAFPQDDSSSSDSDEPGAQKPRTTQSVPPGRTPPQVPSELPPMPDSSSDSDSEHELETKRQAPKSAKAPSTEGPPLPPRPSSALSPRSNSAFLKRKEEMERKLRGETSDPKPLRPKSSIKVSASSDFKAKLAGLGGIKFGQPPPKAIKKKMRPALTDEQQSAENVAEALDMGGLLGGDTVEALAGPSPTELMRDATKMGNLEKRGTGMVNKRWKSRFFILNGDELHWLKNENAVVTQGCINLVERGLVIRKTEDHRTVEITNSKKSYVIRASTAGEMDKWLAALKEVAARQPVKRPAKQDDDVLDPTDSREVDRMMDMLKLGSMFIKYKRKKGKDRMIWCDVGLERVMWGDQTKKKVKGSLLIAEIQRISEGCFGAKNVDYAFTLITPQRTLELEAASAREKQKWLKAIQYLVDKSRPST